jgi:predicted tellurium resistance membrane protein TerC
LDWVIFKSHAEILFMVSKLLLGHDNLITLLLPFSTLPLHERTHALG